jgi:hypothetical protein
MKCTYAYLSRSYTLYLHISLKATITFTSLNIVRQFSDENSPKSEGQEIGLFFSFLLEHGTLICISTVLINSFVLSFLPAPGTCLALVQCWSIHLFFIQSHAGLTIHLLVFKMNISRRVYSYGPLGSLAIRTSSPESLLLHFYKTYCTMSNMLYMKSMC